MENAASRAAPIVRDAFRRRQRRMRWWLRWLKRVRERRDRERRGEEGEGMMAGCESKYRYIGWAR